MKNTFNELIEKCKNLWNIVKQNKKIQYAVIAGLVGVVIITTGIFTALGMKEVTDLPTNDTSRPVISEYDKTTIITIVGNESDTGSESETSGDSDESNFDSETTEDTDNESTEGTEDTVNEPSDNEDTSRNDDPTPAEPSNSGSDVTNNSDNTPTKNTQGTTNNPGTTQSTTKPQVTTQSTTKPPVTTQKPTDPVVNSDAFEVQEKKYDYNGGNVTILNVKNLSSKSYTITIKGTYKDSSGKVLKTENKTFEGFPAGWNNYFVFNPGIKYDEFSFELNPNEYNSKTLANYLHSGNQVWVDISWATSDGSGKYIIPTSPEENAKLKKYTSIDGHFDGINSSYDGSIDYSCDLVVFDNNNDICCIYTPGMIKNVTKNDETNTHIYFVMLITDVLWENKDQYKLPDNLKNVTGIMAIKSITES